MTIHSVYLYSMCHINPFEHFTGCSPSLWKYLCRFHFLHSSSFCLCLHLRSEISAHHCIGKKKKKDSFICLKSDRYSRRKKYVICAYVLYTVTPCTTTRPSHLSWEMKQNKGHWTLWIVKANQQRGIERNSRRCFWNHDTQGNLRWSKTLGFPLQTMVKEMVATMDYNQNIQGTNRVIIFKWDFFSLCLLFYLSACFCHCIYIKLDAHIKEYEKKRKTNVV